MDDTAAGLCLWECYDGRIDNDDYYQDQECAHLGRIKSVEIGERSFPRS
jgi:hypothetical protein